ncbi:mitochondrial inner membrane protease ATP23 [Emericellopsis cladophorae]|uniref:Mitochondrial inner membrane protease ATP23 n=1 Tax=Emericellopsis cladophorae TaxID=2686198 RepID=A0A9P9Y8Z8_9HYPO|nr:mitochondrial inner membrane protease ATP23 [Emericellopsis cladophorae]KAI6785784.1 mitochondrial inner membrane protease ATP23 [Emericellopsis cladophorae]
MATTEPSSSSSSSSPSSSTSAPPATIPTGQNVNVPTPAISSSPGPAPREMVNDPARTGFDPQMKWWMNYFNVLTGKMTKEGMFHFRESRYRVHEERDCKRCDEYRDWLFNYSPIIRFLSEKTGDLNGRLDKSNVVCRRCPARLDEDGNVHRQSGGFSPDHGILLCANEVRDRKHLEDTLAHEMIHAWDHLRWKVDWVGDKDLKHAACTEIRASMLSGECRWTKEFFTRGQWGVTQQFQDCVRRRAVQSVMARPRCKDEEHATKVINSVWDSCFADTRPFDDVYR